MASKKTKKTYAYVKEFLNKNGVEFKTVPTFLFAQVFKKYYNLEILEIDRKFIYEGFVAILQDTIDLD
jgi:hypothetical protein